MYSAELCTANYDSSYVMALSLLDMLFMNNVYFSTFKKSSKNRSSKKQGD